MSASNTNEKRGILMLCLGNICRSPAAEAVMKDVLEKRQLTDHFFVDSCGTGGGSPDWYMKDGFSYHRGDPADSRMRAEAAKRGLKLDSRSRPLTKRDFDAFHIIIGMDDSNLDSIETARQSWGVKDPNAQVALLSQFSSDPTFKGKPVPDPYYGGTDGFAHALNLIEGACDGLADHLMDGIADKS